MCIVLSTSFLPSLAAKHKQPESKFKLTIISFDISINNFIRYKDIISQVFFPESDSDTDNLIQTFVIFGGAFLMRPLGGILIGYVGDKHGRKQALTKSLFLMAIPTTAMGFLPSYERAGWLATALLCLCRLAQGISVGGQLPASLVYTVEKRHASQWGYYGSLPMTAANCGTLLGNLVGAFLRTILTEDQLLSWGWRKSRLSYTLHIMICIVQTNFYFRHSILFGISHCAGRLVDS